MAEAPEIDAVEEIGQTAGLVWHFLHEHGAASVSKLTKDVPAPRDLVLQGLGWLAREDKIAFDRTARGRIVRLR